MGDNVANSEVNQLRSKSRSIKVRIMNSAYEDSNTDADTVKELVIRPISIYLRRLDENDNIPCRPSGGHEMLKLMKKRVVRVAVNRVETESPSSSTSTASSSKKRRPGRSVLGLKNLPATAATVTAPKRKPRIISNGVAIASKQAKRAKPVQKVVKRTSIPKPKKRPVLIKIRIKRNPKIAASKREAKQTQSNRNIKRKSARTPTKPATPNGTKKPLVKRNSKALSKKRQVQTTRKIDIPFPTKMRLVKPWPTKIRNDLLSPSSSAETELPKRYVGTTKAFRIVLQKLNIPGHQFISRSKLTKPAKPKVDVPTPASLAVEEAPTEFGCELCPRKFQTEAALRRHSSFHSFACKDCSEKFTFESALNTHMLIHSEEMKYKCGDCGRRFKHIINFNAHTLSRQCSTADTDKVEQ